MRRRLANIPFKSTASCQRQPRATARADLQTHRLLQPCCDTQLRGRGDRQGHRAAPWAGGVTHFFIYPCHRHHCWVIREQRECSLVPHTRSNYHPAWRIQPNMVGWSHHIHPEIQMRFKSINARWLQRGENRSYHPAEEQQASLIREGERKVFSHQQQQSPQSMAI